MRYIAAFFAVFFSALSFAAFDLSSPFRSDPEFLPVDQAFSLSVTSDNSGHVTAHWDIAEGYYLYRHQLKLQSDNANPIQFASIPSGEIKQDPYFGEVEVYHQTLDLPLTLTTANSEPKLVDFSIRYQGCAEKGLCYPPQTVPMSVEFPVPVSTETPPPQPPETTIDSGSAQEVSSIIADASFSKALLVMFGLGLLLSLTPCVLPMVPIVSAIVVGSKAKGWTGFYYSAIYVLGMALTYALIGALAGWFGTQLNLQAALQSRLVIGLSSALFVLLSLAMFGVFELRLPASLQNKLDQLSSKSQHSKSRILGILLAGVFATLVVSPCVSAPLAGVVLYISSHSDPIYGAAALFTMGLGMGLPLLLVGALGSKVLPKNGDWLEDIKKLMGFAMLGLAIWLATRWLAPTYHLMLWGLWLLSIAGYFLHRTSVGYSHPVRWFIGLSAFILGAIQIVGGTAGNTFPLKPLASFTSYQSATQPVNVPYYAHITSLAELKKIHEQTSAPVVVDLYADWCISCKITEEEIFKAADILPLLKQVTFVQVDVTDNSADNQAFLTNYNLYGPPAMLFFDQNDELIQHYSLIGEPTHREVLDRLTQLTANQ